RSQAVPLQVSIHANDIKGLMFRIDEKYLSTALGQLLCNAIAHSPIGGDVHILTSVVDKVLKISIHDDGIGMSEQDQKKALKPLSQVDGSETRVHGGIGLGLSLAKAIVELHDGELIIDSIVTSGTLVTLVIPNT
ncbi:MAG: sensor histidine kinase, partial [Methylococcales bacterium]